MDELVADNARLKADMLARKTATFFRDAVGVVLSAIALGTRCSVADLMPDVAKLLPGMTKDDLCILKKLYRYAGGRENPRLVPDAATYASLEKHLNEHARIPVELEIGTFTDLKPLLKRVIEWGRRIS